jgi:hypothetical protein
MSRTDNRTLNSWAFNQAYRRVVDSYLQTYFEGIENATSSILRVEDWINEHPFSVLDREDAYDGLREGLFQVGRVFPELYIGLYADFYE